MGEQIAKIPLYCSLLVATSLAVGFGVRDGSLWGPAILLTWDVAVLGIVLIVPMIRRNNP